MFHISLNGKMKNREFTFALIVQINHSLPTFFCTFSDAYRKGEKKSNSTNCKQCNLKITAYVTSKAKKCSAREVKASQ